MPKRRRVRRNVDDEAECNASQTHWESATPISRVVTRRIKVAPVPPPPPPPPRRPRRARMEVNSNPQHVPDVDFWEFVACSKCYLPFVSRGGPTVPFWLTECGHVVCNNHLCADRSCPQCRSPNIQLIPLQADMEAPMSNWFHSIPNSLETVAYAAKFQHETMAAQIRHLKSKVLQYRSLVEQLRRDVTELTRANQALTQGVQYPGNRSFSDYEASDSPNSNGKRRMIPSSHKRKAASSPLTVPSGPDRLTLPPRQAPSLSSHKSRDIGGLSHNLQGSSPYTSERRLDAKHYSYQAPATSQARLPHYSDAQTQALQHADGYDFSEQAHGTSQISRQMSTQHQRSRFKPSVSNGQSGPNNTTNSQGQGLQPLHSRTMGPPPTPRGAPQDSGAAGHLGQINTSRLQATGCFAPPSTNPSRFMPRNEVTRAPPSIGPVGRAPSTMQSNAYVGNQRMPFIPGSFG